MEAARSFSFGRSTLNPDLCRSINALRSIWGRYRVAKAWPWVVGALILGVAIGRTGERVPDSVPAPHVQAAISPSSTLPPVERTDRPATAKSSQNKAKARASRPSAPEPDYSYDVEPLAAYEPPPARRRSSAYSGGAFANCSAARAAGVAPVRAGDPGYSRRLDRDGDGVGCE